ncbi:MAG: class IIb bacteriocin, lactobin A/cerein 7B family [Bacilli bacterium]
MKELNNKELMEVKGGGAGTILIIIAGIVFLIGVIDGYVRPLPCN